MAAARTILHVFSTFAVGGPQRRLATIAAALNGYRHVIAAMDDNHAAAALLGQADHQLVTLSMKKGGAVDIGNLLRLRELIARTKPEILCTYNWGSIEAVIANRLSVARTIVPHIHFEDGFGPDESQDIQLPRRVQMRRLLLRKTPVVVPSRTLEDIALQKWGLQNVHLVPNGIDTAQFHPVGPGDREPDARFVIGTIGAIRPEKNLTLLLEAFVRSGLAGKARLVIAGDGPDLPALTATSEKLGIADSVSFPGHVEDPAALYHTFDLFAMSSDTEQMPLSLLEAMASGLPVIATDVGDVSAMLSSENTALVVPRRDAEGLAEVMRRCASDEALRRRLGDANRRKVLKDYRLQDMIGTYDRLFSGGTV